MTSSLLKRAFLSPWGPQIQAVRFRNRINIQRPRPPHFERHKLLEACKPRYPPRPEYACLKATEQRSKNVENNPFEAILAKELKNWLDHSQFIGFLHMNPIKEEEKFKIAMVLKREGVILKQYGKSIVKRAITNTHYEPVFQLFNSRNAMIFSERTEPIAKILKILRRVPQMILMAGIVEGRLMSRAQLDRFAALPDLTTARAQLVHILAGAAGPGARLVSQLNTHQQNLVSNLDQRVQQLSSEQPVSEN